MKIMKRKKMPKIMIILMYTNKNISEVFKANFIKSIRRTRLCFRYWYDNKGITELLENTEDKLDAIIISGSDYYILERNSPKVPEIIFKYNIHILAICYGMQYIAIRFGKRSYINSKKYGNIIIYDRKLKIDYPFDVKNAKYKYFHNEYVVKVNKNIEVVMKRTRKIDILYYKKRDILGIQFHPEHYKRSGRLFYDAWLSWLSRKNN